MGQWKYVNLDASSRPRGEKDFNKFATARKLHRIIDNIRENYHKWDSTDMKTKQRAVALYFTDKVDLV